MLYVTDRIAIQPDDCTEYPDSGAWTIAIRPDDRTGYPDPDRAGQAQEEEYLTEHEAHPLVTAGPRDPGASAMIWNQLQRDKLSADEREQLYKQLVD
ncbi:hypothetical protein ETB97_011948 [Aspergillus alliaceus]|uniref:Uncharacterized protein n=1 Tax=Petromyces alliaceus TaxID=209559 RepID=A0A8H6ECQ1_PETAA|nr:hypothetical protein ETB97_011948 [Aspergillus burnettii]